MSYTFESIAGYELEKQELKNLCEILKNKKIYEKKGAKLPKGVIFYGEAGNGKTLFAKVLANECNLHTVKIDLGTISNVSEISLLIKDAFEHAKKATQPTMVFFDELDKVLPNDDEEYYTDQSKTILTQLLTLIDEMDNSAGIIFVATCNYYGNLPETIVRPGRIDKKINIGNPTCESRIKILELYMSRTNCKFGLSTSEIAKSCGGFSGAMLETLINECVLHSDKNDFVSEKLIREKIRELKNEDIVRPDSMANNLIYACSNIGCFIVARVFDNGDYILKKDDYTTCNTYFDKILSNFSCDFDNEHYDDEDEWSFDDDGNEKAQSGYFSKQDYLNTISVLMGAYAIQELIFEQTYDNLSFRLALAESILLNMSREGMLGLDLYYNQTRADDFNYHQQRLDNLNLFIEDTINSCYEKAKKILQKNLKLANGLIPILTERESINKGECEKIIEKLGGLNI